MSQRKERYNLIWKCLDIIYRVIVWIAKQFGFCNIFDIDCVSSTDGISNKMAIFLFFSCTGFFWQLFQWIFLLQIMDTLQIIDGCILYQEILQIYTQWSFYANLSLSSVTNHLFVDSPFIDNTFYSFFIPNMNTHYFVK